LSDLGGENFQFAADSIACLDFLAFVLKVGFSSLRVAQMTVAPQLQMALLITNEFYHFPS
jgi:hypothetical protein